MQEDRTALDRAWQAVARAGRREPHYLEVRYEDLVRAPRRTLEAICRFLDLPYHSGMAAHSKGAARWWGSPAASSSSSATKSDPTPLHLT